MKLLLATVVAAIAAIAGLIVPASPAAAEVSSPSCARWTTPIHCTTWLRGNSPEFPVGDIHNWVHLGDKVEYWATQTPVLGTYINKIYIAGDSQSCTYKTTSTGAISTAKPVKVTQTDTFTFNTVGFGMSISSAGSATITANASKTEFYLTTVVTNNGCTSPSYSIFFVPDGIGAIYGMRHTVSTTFDWGGKTVTNGTMDDTSLRII
ncbi:hypothetical protein MRQ36_28760 [Micromonospora sp. R77]|uniref:hypothetical protein n=1 Tax=Micromonospora sp. R77 TaxID=2925836 RepID=UPI001F620B91|nr:hypothetical protein [Micromonospora sp. R77]MCI4066329.1 hypothetical protein [Micromonospora sp. R77]